MQALLNYLFGDTDLNPFFSYKRERKALIRQTVL